MLLKNLIKNISKEKKDILISGITTNSKEVKKNYIFLPLKAVKKMVKNLLRRHTQMAPQL